MGLMIGYHPPSLEAKDIEMLMDLGFRGWERAPQFSAWLVGLLQAEQIRRVQAERGTYLEVEPFAIPLDWTNQGLATALIAGNALAGSVPTFEAGRFADKLIITLVGIVAARLTEREAHCGIA